MSLFHRAPRPERAGAAWALPALRDAMANLRAHRRWAAAFLAGAPSALAFAPFDAWPLFFLAFPVLVWLIDGTAALPWRQRLKAAAACGWWFAFGQFLVGLYWVGNAFLVEADQFGWMVPFIVIGLPALLALFPALAAAGASLVWRPGPARILLLALFWTVGEWLRGHVLSGFPWHLAGTIWAGSDAMIQFAALAGSYGLSLVTVALAAMPAVLGDARWRAPRVLGPLLAAATALVALWLGGAWRLDAVADVPNLRLRLVQANIDQSLKLDPEQRQAMFARYLALSMAPGHERITHLVWPETAVPFDLVREPVAREMIARVVPPGGALFTGAPRLGAGPDGKLAAFNSVLVVDGQGHLRAVFDKFHLVPLGEYLPFPDLLARIGLRQIVAERGGFTPGPGPRTLAAPGAPPVGPLVCYEIIFPGQVVDPHHRPGWLLNLTNDAWFGTTSGPYQHLVQARMRAVEEGLPVMRAANTGISAVIDPYGRVRARLGLNETGLLDAALPEALPPTPYARLGDAMLALLLLLTGLIAWRLPGPRKATRRAPPPSAAKF